jgi:hypothetical protein
VPECAVDGLEHDRRGGREAVVSLQWSAQNSRASAWQGISAGTAEPENPAAGLAKRVATE